MPDKPFPQTVEAYKSLLKGLKERIRQAQVKAHLAVNQELIGLYWSIGKDILSQESEQGWGAKVVDRLALDLKSAFPEVKGFSARNLRYMKAFAESFPNPAKLTWCHLTKFDTEGFAEH